MKLDKSMKNRESLENDNRKLRDELQRQAGEQVGSERQKPGRCDAVHDRVVPLLFNPCALELRGVTWSKNKMVMCLMVDGRTDAARHRDPP